jgi:molybdate transport system substrate-binding protein
LIGQWSAAICFREPIEIGGRLVPGSFRRHPARGSAALSLALGVAAPSLAGAEQVTVFAAASMANALAEIETGFEAATGHDLVLSLAGSSALARQIQQGAPADIFISSSIDWMDAVEAEGLVEPGTRFDLLGNTLVLVAHGTGAEPVAIATDFDLAGLLGEGRLAMALVDAVPAGVYGKAALESLGIWEEVAPRVAQSDNVRAALALVAAGEAPYGIVYATDAAAEDNVTIVGTFPADSHPPIVYPAADLANRDTEAEAAFLAYLRGAEARAAFERQGFVVLVE